MGMHTVWFIIEPCIERTELTKALQQGMVASVKFAPSPGCDIKVLMLMYEHPSKYYGYIPHEQDKFISELHARIQNKIEQILKLKGPIFTQTWKGNRVLHFGGKRFNFVNSNGPKTYWYCNQATKGCRASAVTLDDVIIKMKEHNHY